MFEDLLMMSLVVSSKVFGGLMDGDDLEESCAIFIVHERQVTFDVIR